MIESRSRAQSIRLSELLFLVDEGAVALPDFQRNYQWGVSEVRSLIATILRAWPAGLLLLMEAPSPPFFAMRPIEGGPSVRTGEIRHLVLDGQQRITALYEAFRTPGPDSSEAVWVLDLARYRDHQTVDDLEDSILRLPQNRVWNSRDAAGTPRYIPISALGSTERFFEWRNRVAFSSAIEHDDTQLYVDLNDLWAQSFSRVSEYEFPSVILHRSMPLSDVARVFERLNSSGMVLDTFDLVVAHVYHEGQNLRRAWDEALERNEPLSVFGRHDALLAAELISIRLRGDTRRHSLLSLDASDVWNNWTESIRALNAAAAFLITHAGIPSRELLPHRAIFLVLAALAMDFDLSTHRAAVLYWVFSSALGSRFDAAVNTRVISEYKEINRSLAAGSRPSTHAPSASDLMAATRRSSGSVWLGFQAMIRANGVTDLPHGLFALPLDAAASRAFSLASTAAQRTRAQDPALSILLVSQSAGSLVEGRGPAVLFEILGHAEHDVAEQFVTSQLLPGLVPGHYSSDEEFVARRAEVVLQRLSLLHSEIPTGGRKGFTGLDPSEELGSLALKVDIAKAHLAAHRTSEALRLLREASLETVRALGPDHSDTLSTARALAAALKSAGRPAEAVSLLEETLITSERTAGRDHPATIQTRTMLADALLSAGRLAESMFILEVQLQDCIRLYGVGHPETVRVRCDLAMAYMHANRVQEAVDILQRALGDGVSLWGEEHPESLNVMTMLARALARAGSPTEGRTLLHKVLTARRASLGANDPSTVAIEQELTAEQREDM